MWLEQVQNTVVEYWKEGQMNKPILYLYVLSLPPLLRKQTEIPGSKERDTLLHLVMEK